MLQAAAAMLVHRVKCQGWGLTDRLSSLKRLKKRKKRSGKEAATNGIQANVLLKLQSTPARGDCAMRWHTFQRLHPLWQSMSPYVPPMALHSETA